METRRSRLLQLLAAAIVGFGAGLAIAPSETSRREVVPVPGSSATASEPAPAFLASGEKPPVRERSAGSAALPPVAQEDPSPRGSIGILLLGRVTDPEGRDLDEAFVTLSGEGGEFRTSTSGRNGFRFAGLVPGAWRLEARAHGFATSQSDLGIASGQATVRADLTLARLPSLRVLFTSLDGSPLRGLGWREASRSDVPARELFAIATRQEPPRGRESWAWQSIGVGRFRQDPDPNTGDGVLDLTEPLPLWVSAVYGQAILASTLASAGTTQVSLSLDIEAGGFAPATFKAVIFDAEDQRPLEGARVRFSGESWSREGRSDREGNVRVEGIPPGRTSVRASAEGYLPIEGTLELGAGDTWSGPRFGLVPRSQERPLRGIVVDESGSPVACDLGIAVNPHFGRGPLDAPAEPLDAPPTAVGPDGRFEVCGFGPASFRLMARAEGFAPSFLEIGTHDGPAFDARITLVRGVPVLLQLPGPMGFPWQIELRGDESHFRARSAAGGTALRVHLAPGRYEASAVMREGPQPVLARAEFEVKDEPLEVLLLPD